MFFQRNKMIIQRNRKGPRGGKKKKKKKGILSLSEAEGGKSLI